MREFKDVHDRHCCKYHGCKYGDDNCTVVNGTYEGIFCEDCQYEADVRANNPVKIVNTFEADLHFSWKINDFGFGETSVYFNPDTQKITVLAEKMHKENVRQLLYALADKIVDEGDFQ